MNTILLNDYGIGDSQDGGGLRWDNDGGNGYGYGNNNSNCTALTSSDDGHGYGLGSGGGIWSTKQNNGQTGIGCGGFALFTVTEAGGGK